MILETTSRRALFCASAGRLQAVGAVLPLLGLTILGVACIRLCGKVILTNGVDFSDRRFKYYVLTGIFLMRSDILI